MKNNKIFMIVVILVAVLASTIINITGTLQHNGNEIGKKIQWTPSSVTLSSGTTVQKLYEFTLTPGTYFLTYAVRTS